MANVCRRPPSGGHSDRSLAQRAGANAAWLLSGLFLLLAAKPAWGAQLLPAHRLSGGTFYYTVHKGDSLTSLGSRYGVDSEILAQANGLRARSRLKSGDVLWIDNRHIVPSDITDGILINVPQRMLFVLSHGHLNAAYPVSVGRPGWRTPRGEFTVVELRKNPVWRVPRSIQAEMAAEGKRVRTRVPPGPDNPLGKYWAEPERNRMPRHHRSAQHVPFPHPRMCPAASRRRRLALLSR